MNEKISNENGFSLTVKSGICGYGEDGADGLVGDSGNVIFFSSLTDKDEIESRISDRKNLSNNTDFKSDSIEYNDGDMVLTSDGTIYKIGNGTLTELGAIFKATYPDIEAKYSIATSFGVGGSVEARSYIQKNPRYIGDYNPRAASPFLFHRSEYYDLVGGNWIRFEITGEKLEEYEYVYNIILPSGKKIRKHSTSHDEYIFVENSMLTDIKHKSNKDISEHITENGKLSPQRENSRTVSEKCAEILESKCKFTVDLIHKSSKTVSTFDADKKITE